MSRWGVDTTDYIPPVPSNSDALYRETQRFPGWVMVMVLLAAGLSIGVFAIGFYVQIVRGEPWGDNPVSDEALLLMGFGFIVLGIALIWLFARLRLITEVHPEHLSIRFAPMKPKEIPFDDIAGLESQTFRPIREYGGWGVRYGKGVKAYLAQGNRGVYVTLHHGRNVLVGSQTPDELLAALKMWTRS